MDIDADIDLIYSPKQNWHSHKKWSKGIHTRRVINHWWFRSSETIEIDADGTPILTYPTKENGEWVYESIAIRSAANIEKQWLRKYRYHNDDPSGYWSNGFVIGKSSRRGMKEKARWWQEASEYFEYKEDFAA